MTIFDLILVIVCLQEMAFANRVYLGHLSDRARECDVERFFRGFGRVRDIMLKNGYGFVVRTRCILTVLMILVEATRHLVSCYCSVFLKFGMVCYIFYISGFNEMRKKRGLDTVWFFYSRLPSFDPSNIFKNQTLYTMYTRQ